jgi:hypothetical protein
VVNISSSRVKNAGATLAVHRDGGYGQPIVLLQGSAKLRDQLTCDQPLVAGALGRRPRPVWLRQLVALGET